MDNFNDYYSPVLKKWRLKQLKTRDGFLFVEGDVEDPEVVKRLFVDHDFDAVINLAARAGVRYSMENPRVYLSSNAEGTLNLLEASRVYGVEKFFLASTSSLYAGEAMPYVESRSVNRPISPYAASKKAAEVMAYTYHYLYDIDVSIARFFTVYGPAGRPDMSPLRFIKWIDAGTPIKLFGDGSQSRDFTYVDDVARGVIAALKPVGYEIVNIGGGKNPISIKTMIETFERMLGKKAVIDQRPFNKSDMMHTWADISKAKELFDWEPQVDFETGMRQTVDWYLENRDWLVKLDF